MRINKSDNTFFFNVNNKEQSNVKNNNEKKTKNNKFQKKDGLLVSLNKQLIKLKDEMAKLTSNTTMPEKQKKLIKKDLTRQMGEVNSQIMERQMQLMKIKEEEQQKKAEEKAEKKAQERIKAEDEEKVNPNLLKVTKHLSKLKSEHSASKDLSSKARILESEIKLDEGRGIDVSEKREKLAKMKDKLNKLSEKMSESLSEVNNEMKKNVKSTTDLQRTDGKEDNSASTKGGKSATKADEKKNGRIVKDGKNFSKKLAKNVPKKDNMYYVSTNKVDRQIEKIKTEKEKISKEIATLRAIGENSERLEKMTQKLANLEAELLAKDNDAFRKANSEGYF